MADDQEKEYTEEEAEEKRKQLPWWKNLSPWMIAVGALLIFLLIRGMTVDTGNKNNYIWYIVAVVVIFYLLTQTKTVTEETMISPKEAELLVERECERKSRWGQFPPMTTYAVGPVINLQHKDGGGVYYDVCVEVRSNYTRPVYYVAKVMAKGLEKGFVTMIESVAPITGREKVQERTIIPKWVQTAEDYPVIKDMMGNG